VIYSVRMKNPATVLTRRTRVYPKGIATTKQKVERDITSPGAYFNKARQQRIKSIIPIANLS